MCQASTRQPRIDVLGIGGDGFPVGGQSAGNIALEMQDGGAHVPGPGILGGELEGFVAQFGRPSQIAGANGECGLGKPGVDGRGVGSPGFFQGAGRGTDHAPLALGVGAQDKDFGLERRGQAPGVGLQPAAAGHGAAAAGGDLQHAPRVVGAGLFAEVPAMELEERTDAAAEIEDAERIAFEIRQPLVNRLNDFQEVRRCVVKKICITDIIFSQILSLDEFMLLLRKSAR